MNVSEYLFSSWNYWHWKNFHNLYPVGSDILYSTFSFFFFFSGIASNLYDVFRSKAPTQDKTLPSLAAVLLPLKPLWHRNNWNITNEYITCQFLRFYPPWLLPDQGLHAWFDTRDTYCHGFLSSRPKWTHNLLPGITRVVTSCKEVQTTLILWKKNNGAWGKLCLLPIKSSMVLSLYNSLGM